MSSSAPTQRNGQGKENSAQKPEKRLIFLFYVFSDTEHEPSPRLKTTDPALQAHPSKNRSRLEELLVAISLKMKNTSMISIKLM